MTKENFLFLIETQKPFEFTYNHKVYNMTYEKTSEGKVEIVFGQLYEGKHYESVGELFNNAKIENHYFKDMLDIL